MIDFYFTFRRSNWTKKFDHFFFLRLFTFVVFLDNIMGVAPPPIEIISKTHKYSINFRFLGPKYTRASARGVYILYIYMYVYQNAAQVEGQFREENDPAPLAVVVTTAVAATAAVSSSSGVRRRWQWRWRGAAVWRHCPART